MYWTLAVAWSFSLSEAVPFRPAVRRLIRLVGTMPLIWSLPNERRKFARSPEPVALMLFDTDSPLSKKSRTLLGDATHGTATPWLYHCGMRRPSSLGPQLSSTPSYRPS